MLGECSGTCNTRRSNDEKDVLRSKFVAQALTYIGVPYARKYHDETCKSWDYNTVQFLLYNSNNRCDCDEKK